MLRVATWADSSPNSDGNSGGENGKVKQEPFSDYNDVVNDTIDSTVVDLTRDENKTPDVKSPAKIFTFGSVKKSEAPLEKPNFSFAIPVDSVEMFKKSLAAQSFKPKLAPLKPAELVTDKNNNPPKPALPKQVAEIAPTVKKDDSKFTLWIKFKDPNLPNSEMCRMVREALGMSAKDSVAAKSVVPNHLRCTGQAWYASFKIVLDARWREKALDSATWRLMENYVQHSEWVER